MERDLEFFARTERLIGANGVEKLKQSRVAVIGLGGVGSYAVEALARAGIGYLRLVDHDRYTISNLNRQLHALVDTIGELKTEVVKERLLRINPSIRIDPKAEFIDQENVSDLITEDLDYIIDAIDTVSSKVLLIEYCRAKKIKLISCMGTGNRLDPTGFCFSDISETHTCPLARAVRSQLRKKGITHGVETLFSTIPPLALYRQKKEETGVGSLTHEPMGNHEHEKKLNRGLNREHEHERGHEGKGGDGSGRGRERAGVCENPPGSISFVPSVAGLLLAGLVVKRIIGGSPVRQR